MDCFGRPYHFKCFENCLQQTLLGPFLNTLSHLTAVKKMSFQTLELLNIKYYKYRFTNHNNVVNLSILKNFTFSTNRKLSN